VSLCHCVTVSLCHCVTVSCCRSLNGWFNAASVSVRRWTAKSSRTLGSVIKMNRFLSPSSLSSSLSSYISACSSFLNFHLLCLLRLLPLLHLLLILVLLSLLRLHLRIHHLKLDLLLQQQLLVFRQLHTYVSATTSFSYPNFLFLHHLFFYFNITYFTISFLYLIFAFYKFFSYGFFYFFFDFFLLSSSYQMFFVFSLLPHPSCMEFTSQFTIEY